MKMWMPSCKDISRLVSESMERRLSWRKRAGIRFHLLMCRHCSRYQKQLILLQKLLRTQSESLTVSSQAKLNDKAKEKLRQLVDLEDPSRKES